jgi:hypothetical protein
VACWEEIVHSTLSIDGAAQAICDLYRATGRRAPAVLILPSPMTCLKAWKMLATLPDEPIQERLRLELAREMRSLYRPLYLAERTEVLRAALRAVTGDRHAESILGSLYRLGELTSRFQRAVMNEIRLRGHEPPDDVWPLLEPALALVAPSMRRRVRIALRKKVTPPRGAAPDPVPPAACWGAWTCFGEAVDDCLGCLGVRGAGEVPLLQAWIRQAQACHWWLPFEGIVFVSERPRHLGVDARGRPHGEGGAAIEYGDGTTVFAWHGSRVDKRLITDPGSITTAEIDEPGTTAELRRVKIARYGPARYLKDAGAVVHQDKRGTLWRKERPGDTPLVMVEVRNATQEADGSVKTFFLRVPPQIERAADAVAWTFGMSADRYAPVLES